VYSFGCASACVRGFFWCRSGSCVGSPGTYYSSFWFPHGCNYYNPERIFRYKLWGKPSVIRGLPLVPGEVCTLVSERRMLGLVDVRIQGLVFIAKWNVRAIIVYVAW
jgi:hypothetical protein